MSPLLSGKHFRWDTIWLRVGTHLGVELQRSGVFDEGLDDAGAAQGVRGHHEHLVLLHRVEEGPHVGSHGLHGNADRRKSLSTQRVAGRRLVVAAVRVRGTSQTTSFQVSNWKK